MKISIIIPAYNEELYIRECLSNIEQNRTDDVCEVIVVDNASTDRTAEIARQFSFATVLSEPKKGNAHARQMGFKKAKGDLLAFLDADTRMPEGWIEKAIAAFDKNKNIVSISGPYKYYDGSRFNNWIINTFWWMSAPLTYKITGYMILGGNFVVKKDSLAEIGGFDETINFYGDDTDLARRLDKFGKVMFNMNFLMYSSSRRFVKEGILKTSFVYAINFIWQAIFHRPFNQKYSDVRIIETKN